MPGLNSPRRVGAQSPEDAVQNPPIVDPQHVTDLVRQQARAIIALRLAKLASDSGDRAAADEAIDPLAGFIDASLSTAPADAYLWLALYWIKSRDLGANAETFPYLRASHKYEPNERWIASRRIIGALAAYLTAPDDLPRSAVADFGGLVSSGLCREAADALLGPGWVIRQTLLDRIAAFPKGERDAFMQEVDRRRYDVGLPGLQRRNARPWH